MALFDFPMQPIAVVVAVVVVLVASIWFACIYRSMVLFLVFSFSSQSISSNLSFREVRFDNILFSLIEVAWVAVVQEEEREGAWKGAGGGRGIRRDKHSIM